MAKKTREFRCPPKDQVGQNSRKLMFFFYGQTFVDASINGFQRGIY